MMNPGYSFGGNRFGGPSRPNMPFAPGGPLGSGGSFGNQQFSPSMMGMQGTQNPMQRPAQPWQMQQSGQQSPQTMPQMPQMGQMQSPPQAGSSPWAVAPSSTPGLQPGSQMYANGMRGGGSTTTGVPMQQPQPQMQGPLGMGSGMTRPNAMPFGQQPYSYNAQGQSTLPPMAGGLHRMF